MQDNEKKPALRFKGFTDPWEQRKLGEICDFITKGATPTTYGFSWQPDGVPFFRNDSIKDNVFVFGEFSYISEAANEVLKRSEVHGNDILIAITGDIGKVGIIPDTVEKANINQHIARVRIRKEALPYFVYQYLASDDTQKEYQKIKTGLSMPQLSLEQVRDIVVKIPEFNEQGKIADCLRRIDTLITLHQRKYEKLVNIKKSMLDKMFPQNGESVPEIRFKGFTDPWEQRKLGELSCSFEYGLNAAAKEYDGQNKYLRITDIDDTSRQFVTTDITSPDTNLTDADSYKLSDGDVLFARTGASVGKTYLYKKFDGLVYFAGFLIRAKIKEGVNAGFIFQNTLTRGYERYIAITSQRSGQPGVNAQEYAEYQLMLPELFEQDKIAKLLEALDTLITLHQRKLEKLQNIKKSCLEKMFV